MISNDFSTCFVPVCLTPLSTLAYAGYAEIVLAYRSVDKKAFILFTLELSSPPLSRAVITAVELVAVHFVAHELTAAFELGTLCGWTRMC